MKFRCDHCGKDSLLDRDSLVVLEGDEVPHIKCKLCGKMSVFGGGQLFSGARPPVAAASAPAPVVPVIPAPPKRGPIILLSGIAAVAVLMATASMMIAMSASTKVLEMKWNKADVAALGDQEAEHERHDHHQARVVLGSPGTAQVGVLPVFLSAPTIRREGDGFWVDGLIHNGLAMAMDQVEIRFVDDSGKEKIGATKVGMVGSGSSTAWRVFLPGLGLKDERFVSVYAVVDHQLQFVVGEVAAVP